MCDTAQLEVYKTKIDIMLFAGWEVHTGKNCALGLEHGPWPAGLGHEHGLRVQFFPIRTYLGRQITCLFFSSLENYFIRNICVVFLLTETVSNHVHAFDISLKQTHVVYRSI